MRSIATLLLLALTLAPAEMAAAPRRIMPLGDSITESATDHASYRYWLWHDLLDAGYSVDFVGSMTGVYGGPPQFSDFDQNHEGHWGWRADQVLAQLPGWAATHQPEIVLLHLGTNDLFQNQGVTSTLQDLSGIIDALRTANPSVVVLIAQLIPVAPWVQSVPIAAFNAQVPGFAQSKTTQASPVLVVDQYTGFDPDADTWDGVHPDGSGENKMADRWFAALGPILSGPAGVGTGPSAAGRLRATPSPASGPVSISYWLERGSRVRITVEDVAGRRRAVLAEGWCEPGSRAVVWDGRAADGKRLPGGLYIVRLEAGPLTATRKIVLTQ